MKMKFKSTAKLPKGLLYRRFIGLEKSINLTIVYKTDDGKFWTFDNETLTFSQTTKAEGEIVTVETNKTILKYQSTYFKYDGTAWETLTELPENVVLLNASFNNIGRYQTNKYYYVGSFDFMIKGSVEGTTAQFIKGNIIPLSSMNIKYFTDDITINHDDLVVVDKRLFSVENTEMDIKYNPKPYKVYFATLNSIL